MVSVSAQSSKKDRDLCLSVLSCTSTRTSNEGLEHSSELSGLAAQPGTLAAPLASGRWRAGGGRGARAHRAVADGGRTGLRCKEGRALERVSSLVSRDTREVERVERARAHSESLSKAQLRGGQGSHTTQSHARAWLRVKASPAYGSDRPSCRASTTAGRSGPRHPRGSRARRACSPTGWRAPGLWLGKGRVRVLVRVRVRVRVGLVTWWRQPVPKKATASPKVAWLGLG